jgi:predicted permease
MKEVRCSAVRGDFYQALGIPLKAGRLFDQTDLPEGPQVVVVNEAFVRRYLPDRNPLGLKIRLGPNPSAPWETIVGIVGDVRQFSLESEPVPTVVENDAQHAWGSLGVVVRTSGNPRSFERAVRAAIREADPTLAARSMRTMEEIIGQTLVPRRFSLALIGSFAVLALVLAAVGTYGVLAYTVTARTRELGIRMALGAEASRVGATVVGRGLRWTATGLLVGAGGAVLVARSLSSMLFGVTAADPTTLASVSVALVVVTLVACIVPARRALKVDPIVAMRAD